MDVRIEPARADDLGDVFRLLTAQHLPLEGLRDHMDTMVVARQNGQLVGSAALEIYADGALLRSVAVAPGRERQSLGRRLTEAAIRLAEERRVPALYLLTTTAAAYFPKFGFERITRAAVPTGVQASVEFAFVCCSSATVMRKQL